WTTVIEDSPVTYLDTTVVSGHTYCYYVIANPLGNNQSTAQGPPSAPSNTACVGAPYQATPPVLSGSLSGTNAVLNWTAATITGSTITNYLLYRNVDAGAFSLFQTLGNVLTYTDTTTTVGHTYGYKVQGVPAVGVPSAFSNTVFETPVATGQIVAVGHAAGSDNTSGTPIIFTRSVGGVWAQQTAPGIASLGLTAVAHSASQNQWLALTKSHLAAAKVDSSADGVSWAQNACPWPFGSMLCAAFGAGTWAVNGATGGFMTSPDGINWTAGSTSTFAGSYVSARHGLAYGNGVFVTTGTNSGGFNIYHSI